MSDRLVRKRQADGGEVWLTLEQCTAISNDWCERVDALEKLCTRSESLRNRWNHLAELVIERARGGR